MATNTNANPRVIFAVAAPIPLEAFFFSFAVLARLAASFAAEDTPLPSKAISADKQVGRRVAVR